MLGVWRPLGFVHEVVESDILRSADLGTVGCPHFILFYRGFAWRQGVDSNIIELQVITLCLRWSKVRVRTHMSDLSSIRRGHEVIARKISDTSTGRQFYLDIFVQRRVHMACNSQSTVA